MTNQNLPIDIPVQCACPVCPGGQKNQSPEYIDKELHDDRRQPGSLVVYLMILDTKNPAPED